MTDTQIELQFEGPGAEDLAMALFELLELRLGTRPRVERPAAADGEQHRGIDPALAISVLSLVVSVPSGALSTIQLIEWLQKRRAAEAAAPVNPRAVRIAVRGSDAAATVSPLEAREAIEVLTRAAEESQKT